MDFKYTKAIYKTWCCLLEREAGLTDVSNDTYISIVYYTFVLRHLQLALQNVAKIAAAHVILLKLNVRFTCKGTKQQLHRIRHDWNHIYVNTLYRRRYIMFHWQFGLLKQPAHAILFPYLGIIVRLNICVMCTIFPHFISLFCFVHK